MNFLKSLDFKLVGIIIALVAAESFAQLFLETATLKSKKRYKFSIRYNTLFNSRIFILYSINIKSFISNSKYNMANSNDYNNNFNIYFLF